MDGVSRVRRLVSRASGIRERTLYRVLHLINGNSEVLSMEQIMSDLSLTKLRVVHWLHEQAIRDIFGDVIRNKVVVHIVNVHAQGLLD